MPKTRNRKNSSSRQVLTSETGPKDKIHYVHPLLYNGLHQVNIAVAGTGGTGTMVIRELARMNFALRAINKPGLHVVAYDPDTVTQANLGRQLFTESELGLNKAEALMTRINRVYGTQWQGISQKFRAGRHNPTIAICCVDSVKARLSMLPSAKSFDYSKHDNIGGLQYWIDCGNGHNFGQVIVGTSKKIKQPDSEKFITVEQLPMPQEKFKNVKEQKHEPSCSLAQALGRQDLMINSMIAQIACQLVWQMVQYNYLLYRGAYLNLANLTMRPIKL